MRSPNKKNCSVRRSALSFGQIVLLALVAWPCYQIGIFAIASNFRVVVPGRIYRSGQPEAGQLETWIHRYGLKTIVNLRGSMSPRAAEEEAVADATGVRLVHIALSASRPMTHEQLLDVLSVLDDVEEPVLIHCAHGVDRSGTVSAMAAWLIGGWSYEKAKWQAFVPPGPWKNRRGLGHISDTLSEYEAYCRNLGLAYDDPNRFRRWAAEAHYDPDSYLTARFGLHAGADPNSAGADVTTLSHVATRQLKQTAALR